MSHTLRGLIGEYLALMYLFFTGHRILHHRYRSKAGEVDIIACTSHSLLFIEVKVRSYKQRFLAIDDVITYNQRNRICHTAAYYYSKHPAYRQHGYRCDAIIIYGWRTLRYVKAII